MVTTAPELAEMAARLERVERLLLDMRRPTPKLLSKRAAAKMLGVDRGTTLEGLIRSGALHLVLGRIPLPDVERLLTEGVPPPKPRTRREPARTTTPAEEAAAVRAMKV